MKTQRFLIGCLLFASVHTAAAQAGDRTLPRDLTQLSDSLRRLYAPDSRVALFNVAYTVADKNVMLRGETTSAQAKKALLEGLAKAGYTTMDCLRLLPDEEALGGKTYAIVNLSVSNLRIEPDFSAEMTTQALLGMPVRVLERKGWYRVQTPDNYIAWVNGAALCRVSREELTAWNRAEKVIVTAHYGVVYSQPDAASQTLSDVVAGNRLKYLSTKGAFFEVAYPDGRTGYISRSIAQTEKKWRASLRQDAQSIIQTARTLMGVPYLWAGTSSKGIDCSGLMRTVLYLHDIIIPRDASQQAYKGERLEIAADFANLQPGDLLFFGRKATAGGRERVVHVGMYIGGKQFIHSQGYVQVGSFAKEDPLFDAYNLGRLLFAARILPHINQGDKELNTTATNSYFNL
ncbi:MAG: C40 family peptidase [Prevotellaceae bacterium]|jgi:cell wall-associated NlpC family hydrolase|nr:C40 family peptidase [Prevotellaceae bacterium]